MNTVIPLTKLNEKIHSIRGMQVMLDSELASIYGVETKVFNQAVKRNIERFPEEFRFQLTELEYQNLRSQTVTSSNMHGGRRHLPYVFAEQGVAMLSAVLKSKTAIEVSIQIINAFVQMRKLLASQGGLFQRLEYIERKQNSFELQSEKKFEEIFAALENKEIHPSQGIFYDGQVFDAYLFISKLIRKAKDSIVLLDNYIDETVLDHLSKSNPQVKIFILTKNNSSQLKLDIKKYNQQYLKIELIKFDLAHDRFLIIDENEIYHIGASLKDLGKKWFAFSKIEANSIGFMNHVKKILTRNSFN
ncbi:MAG: ORF6N domain-containing protein [Tatlockia sp.]|nr:ORF6N domain-containing protein [Tatlockia sp.]